MNSLTFSLLRMLAGGEFRSGEDMARGLGVSRASVWNALHGLDRVGLEVFKVRGRGYRLAQPLTLLDSKLIVRALGTQAPRFNVEVLERVESTNTLLLQRAAAGAPGGSVLAAEWQTLGRGRGGRVWHAAPTAALTFSLLWRFQQGASLLAGLSLAVGVAVTRALRALGVYDAGLKWPNDVIWDGRKIAGILIEVQGDMLGPSAAVIGIGLNCRLPESLRDCIDQPAVDLETACGSKPDRNQVLALLLLEMARAIDVFVRDGFVALRTEWQNCHIHQHQPVRLALPDGSVILGTAQGVAEDGSLLLATKAGVRRFHGGEVSLRGQDRGSRIENRRPAINDNGRGSSK